MGPGGRCHRPEAGRPPLYPPFFTGLVLRSADLCPAMAGGRDMRKMMDQTASITRPPGRLHLPPGPEPPVLVGQNADTRHPLKTGEERIL